MIIKYYCRPKNQIIELCISTEDERYVDHDKDTVNIRIQRNDYYYQTYNRSFSVVRQSIVEHTKKEINDLTGNLDALNNAKNYEQYRKNLDEMH